MTLNLTPTQLKKETMRRLLGKKAVITGGSNGIGRAIALAFMREGADVLITYNREESAAKQVTEQAPTFNVKATALQMDAADFNCVDVLYNKAGELHGVVDILVNNIGITTRDAFLDISLTDYENVQKVNVTVPFFLTQRFAASMKSNHVRGSIINVSSISAFKAISRLAHYQCSKAALSMLSKSAALELAEFGIRVNTLSPGLTATKGNSAQWKNDPALWEFRGKDIPLGRAGVPEDHAEAAVFLASDASSWMTGAEIIIDGGESAL